MDDPVALKPDFPGVGHHEERLSSGPVQFTQERHELSGTHAVEVPGRFICPHDCGGCNDGASNRHPLLLSTRQSGRSMGLPVREIDGAQSIAGTLTCLRWRSPGEQERELHVLDRSEHGQQIEALEHKAHRLCAVPGQCGVVHARERGPVNENVATIDGVDPGEAVQQRCLAAPTRTHDGDHFATSDPEVDTAEGRNIWFAFPGGVCLDKTDCFNDPILGAIRRGVWRASARPNGGHLISRLSCRHHQTVHRPSVTVCGERWHTVDRVQGATGSKRLTSDALRPDPYPAGAHCYDANRSPECVALGTVRHFRRGRLTRLR